MEEIQTLLLSNVVPTDICYNIYYKIASQKVPCDLKRDIILYKKVHYLIESCNEKIELEALRHYMLHQFVLDHKFLKTYFVISDIKSLWCMLYPEEKEIVLQEWDSNRNGICFTYYDSEESYKSSIEEIIPFRLEEYEEEYEEDNDDIIYLWPLPLKYYIKN